MSVASGMSLDEMLAEWVQGVPAELTRDVLWTAEVYRWATFACERVEANAVLLLASPTHAQIAPQLLRAVGSVGANFAEGYSRLSPKDRCRLYEYSLGSAREARHWAYACRKVLGEQRTRELLGLLTKLIQQLTVIIRNERKLA